MNGKLKDLTINRDGSQNLTITINEDFRETFDKLKNEEITIEIKKASKRRSMDANNYFWRLCGEIAKVSSQYSTDGKDEVYREAIKKKGEFELLAIKDAAIEKFMKRWGEKGTGWFAEVVDDVFDIPETYVDFMGDKRDSYKLVCAYYGSSTYDSQSMSRLIDYVVMIANDLGIQTLTTTEQERIITAWGKKRDNNE